MKKNAGKALAAAGIIIGALLLCIAGYVVYVYASYYRIEDNLPLEITKKASAALSPDGEYTAVTYNIGFGAYSPDFSFFMDGGKESVARDKPTVIKNINGSIETVKKLNADFILLQEADVKATRSYGVNQHEMIVYAFPGYDSVLAVNYDSPFLFWPPIKPHGKSLAGLVTLADYRMSAAERRSLPISTSFSKFFDLDRCFSVQTVPMDNGKNLYVYNVHLSAYGGTPEIRAAQVNKLFGDIESKYRDGHYVICGGDFNHDLPGDSVQRLNKLTDDFSWAQPFPFDMLPAGIRFVGEFADANVPTVRNCDSPYIAGKTYVAIIDGFFVTDNIAVKSLENIDNQFSYSDHNPVLMRFTFK